MKIICALFLCMLCACTYAQTPKAIYGTWVKTKITFSDGGSLPDDNVLKYVYLKYKFAPENGCNISTSYFDLGDDNNYLINDNYLVLKSPQGGLINSFQIKAISDTLILQQPPTEGIADSDLLRYYFVRENVYRDAIALKPSDIYSIMTGDTVYNESPKIYASYNGISFQRYIYKSVDEKIDMDGRVGHLVASFIVSKKGVADSVKILEGIDDNFNKQFLKVFNKVKKDWKPATLKASPVAVKMMVELRYSTSETAIPAEMATQNANKAYNDKEYELAIYYYDKALASRPSDQGNLFKRGMCKLILGNNAGACEDWNKAIEVGGNMEIESLLKKYCK